MKDLDIVPEFLNYLNKIISSVGKFLIEDQLLELSFPCWEVSVSELWGV